MVWAPTDLWCCSSTEEDQWDQCVEFPHGFPLLCFFFFFWSPTAPLRTFEGSVCDTALTQQRQGQRGGPVVGRMLWNNENTHSEQTLWSEQTTPPPHPRPPSRDWTFGHICFLFFMSYSAMIMASFQTNFYLYYCQKYRIAIFFQPVTLLPQFESSWVFFATSLSSLELVMFCWRWAAGRTWLTSSPLPVAQHNRPHYRCYWGTATKACLMSPCGISWGPYFT